MSTDPHVPDDLPALDTPPSSGEFAPELNEIAEKVPDVEIDEGNELGENTDDWLEE